MAIEQLQVFRTQSKRNVFLLSRRKGDSLETTKLLDGSCDWSEALVQIELDGLYAGQLPRVLDVYAHSRVSTRVDLHGLNAQVAVLELGVAQSVAERIERRARHIRVTRHMSPSAA